MKRFFVAIVTSVLFAGLLPAAPAVAAGSGEGGADLAYNGSTHSLYVANFGDDVLTATYTDATYGTQTLRVEPGQYHLRMCADPAYDDGWVDVTVVLHAETDKPKTVVVTLGGFFGNYLLDAKKQLRQAKAAHTRALRALKKARRQHQGRAAIRRTAARVAYAARWMKSAKRNVRYWEREYQYCADRRLE